MQKIVAIIQARLTSKRLPRKILMNLGGKPIIERVIDAVKDVGLVDKIVVASPHEFKCSVPIFIGDEFDVLKRYYDCAMAYDADIVVRITSDCPLLDSDIIEFAILYFRMTKYEYVYFAPVDGLDVEVFTMQILKEANMYATERADREHVTPYMKRKTKISVDTKSDLLKVRNLWNGRRKLY